MMWIQTPKEFFFALLSLMAGCLMLFALTIIEKDIPAALEQTISRMIPSFSPHQKIFDDNSESDALIFAVEGIEFTLGIESQWQGIPLAIHSSGTCAASNNGTRLSIHSCSGTFDALSFDLLQPITLSEHQEKWTATPLKLKIGDGELALAYAEEKIQGALRIENLPLTSIPFHLIGLPSLNGMLSLEASLTGPLSTPQLQLVMHTYDMTSANDVFSKLGPANGELTLSLENQHLAVQGHYFPSHHFPIDFDLQFPVAFGLSPFTFTIPSQAPLSGNIKADFEVAPLLYSLLDKPTTFSGHAAASVQLSGTYSQPEFLGGCRLTNGAYEIPEIGVSLTDLSANIEANGTRLQIKDLQAVDGKGGNVTGTGYYLIEPAQRYPFALELDLKGTALLNQDYVQIVCNGPLTFSGDLDRGKLQGQLQASTATIAIPDRSYAARNVVDVTYNNIPQHLPSPQSLNLQQTSPWPLDLNIHLQFPRSLSITGRDLSSTWRGEVDVQGTAKEPLLFGELKVSDGEYLFNGNPFDINQGTITFAGDIDKKTTLYVIAGKDLDKVKVNVIAKGAIKNPEISFRSNPPLPQREILSWILFNRGTSEISSFQGAQLSESITNLSTNQQGPDVLSKIRSTLGIDRFEISRNPNSGNNDVNIQIGKYISDNFLISVIKSDVSQVAIEATLTDTVKVQAQVGEDAQGQLLLKWKRDY